MVWGLRAPIWFGLALAATLLFLWCLVSMIEAGASSAGYLWGLIVFGIIAIAAGLISLLAQASNGGVATARDALYKQDSFVPKGQTGRGLAGSGLQPNGIGEIPRSSSGRAIK